MNVLALTHAHLKKSGLSPVSCERADSVTGTWANRLGWTVDVVHTNDTKWVGIWPNGTGLKINILHVDAGKFMLPDAEPIFSKSFSALMKQLKIFAVVSLIYKRIKKKALHLLAKNGYIKDSIFSLAEKWGWALTKLPEINKIKYDFIFVCVGYGDEYLLETGFVLSKKLKTPMVVDYRDLWSQHHDPFRFTQKQKEIIRKHEIRLLANTRLISVPQKHLVTLLNEWVKVPVYHLQHSAFVGDDWEDGSVVSKEFRIVYAGKLYATGPGIGMLLELLKKLSDANIKKQFKCHFFVDDIATLNTLAANYNVSDKIVVNGWTMPSNLWKSLRSAHLLVIIDSSTEENYPILLTKTFQYSYTGRQLLCLTKFENPEMVEFLEKFDAGKVFTDTELAKNWVIQLSEDSRQYENLPPLRNIPMREDVAEAFGNEIKKLIP